MICSTSFFRNIILLLAAGLLGLPGCVVLNSRQPVALQSVSLKPDKAAPQVAGKASIRWRASARGGSGGLTYEFMIRDGIDIITVQTGPSDIWSWTPSESGGYQVQVVARDTLGNEVESGWSYPYEVAPELQVDPPGADIPSPQAAKTATVNWQATARGGAGDRTYAFILSDGRGETIAQRGSSPAWQWKPEAAGTYRVKTVVSDALGNEVESGWSEEYEVAPELQVDPPGADRPSPQAAKMAAVAWQAAASGGVGELAYEFVLADKKGEAVVQRGSSPAWQWKPEAAGTYRVKAVVSDALGNKVESGWSGEYVVAPELKVETPQADKPSPQAAKMAAVGWQAAGSGGVGDLTYVFTLSDAKGETVVQSGASPEWQWRPEAAGAYRVKTVVSDALGNEVESGWSGEYEVAPELKVDTPQADRPSPQAAKMAAVGWQAAGSGGVGDLTYVFTLSDTKGETVVQSGASPEWQWRPEAAGTYRVKTVVSDALGNEVESGWSEEYEVAPELKVEALRADKPGPQAANMTVINWQATARGGVGEIVYEFTLSDGEGETVAQSGFSPIWGWTPQKEGLYRVKVTAKDIRGNAVGSGWSEPYEVAPELKVEALQADKPFPQAANMTTVAWQATARGGLGELAYEFILADEKGEVVVQSGTSPEWQWKPEASGAYRVNIVVSDTLGNRVESGWSEEYEVAPELKVEALRTDKPAPQAANMTTIGWQALASGGVGDLVYEFSLKEEEVETAVQSGFSPFWQWAPQKEGYYRAKVIVKDIRGNIVESGWSEPYEVVPELKVESFKSDLPSPQVAKMAVVGWQAAASGGVGAHTYAFLLSDGEREIVAQQGAEPAWAWRPETAGVYRVKAVVSDAIGNKVESGWSGEYEVAPELKLEGLVADKPSPQAANMAVVSWQAVTTGGVPPLVYKFSRSDGEVEVVAQYGASSVWPWKPWKEGTYMIKAVVRDALGNTVESGWSEGYEVAPELKLEAFKSDKPSPQAADMTVVDWQAMASGGVGERVFAFIIADEKGETVAQIAPSSVWQWRPEKAGTYKVKAVVSDAINNMVESDWSEVYKLAPELKLKALKADKLSPQRAVISPIQWQALAEGGVPPLSYTFKSIKDGKDLIEQKGSSPVWQWVPEAAGTYRVKVTVVDSRGNLGGEILSEAFAILPVIDKNSQLVVLPVENLSGTKAPLQDIGRVISAGLARKGYQLLDNERIEAFRKKYRVRYTGGVGVKISQAMREEIGADAFLITSLTTYKTQNPPKISLISRLVASGEQPEIVWIDSIGMSGDQAPGLLDLTRISDPKLLLEKAVSQLTDSFAAHFESDASDKPKKPLRMMSPKYLPYDFSRSPIVDPHRKYVIAVIPFLNLATRSNAGNIVALHYIKELYQLTPFRVMEPGVLREQLLRFRAIMPAGPSLAVTDLITSSQMLGVDLVLSGKVFDYQTQGPIPKVNFSVQVIEKLSRRVVFDARAFSTGDKGVYFFDIGRVFTAHDLTEKMSRTMMQLLTARELPEKIEEDEFVVQNQLIGGSS